MTDLLICPKCGQELEKNSRYCLNCGYCLSLEDNETNYTPVDNKTNICAVIGFVLSLVGGFFVAVSGLVLSAIGLKKANREGYDLKGLAIAGLIIAPLKIFAILIVTFLYLFFVLGFMYYL